MQTLDPVSEYIVEAAARRGIDPAVALRVAKSEGLNEYVGDGGSSFGPFQLHYGGVASGGNRVAGLGDDFTKATGLNARDPNTWQAQVDFALDHAKRHGWGAFHGAAKVGLDNFAGIGGNSAGGPNRYNALTSIAGGSDPTSGMSAPNGGPASPPGGMAAPNGAPGGMSSPNAGGVGATGMGMDQGYQALMQSIMQPRQRTGLLGQLLFGQGGLGGFLQQSMPNGLLGGAANGIKSFMQPSPMSAPNGGPGAPMGGGGTSAMAPQLGPQMSPNQTSAMAPNLGPQMSPPQPQQAQAPQQPGMPFSQPPGGQGGGQMAQVPDGLRALLGMFGMGGGMGG